MKKIVLLLILGIFILPVNLVFAARQGAQNPQLIFMGARPTALGGTLPTIPNELQSVFLNPASIANIKKVQFSATNKNIYGLIDGLAINSCFYLLDITWGASFGYQMLNNIGYTMYDSDRIRAIGSTYSAGTRLYQLTAAKGFNQVLPHFDLMLGINGKVYNQVIAQDSRYALGLDLGAIIISDVLSNKNSIGNAYFGISLINLWGTTFTWGGTDDKNDLDKKLILGFALDTLNNSLNVSVHNNIDNRISYGLEYYLPNNITVRGSTDFNYYNAGIGMAFNQLYGFFNQSTNLRFDYAYTQYQFLTDGEATHTFTISFF